MTEHSTDLPFFGGSFDVSMGAQLAWGVGFCLLWAVLIELWLKLNVPWLAKQPFWKGGAQAVQRKLLNNFGFPSEPTLAFRLPLVTDCPAAVSAALSQSASEKELIMVSAVMTSGLSLKAPPDATARTRTALSPCASILTSWADAASRTMRHDGEAAAEASVAAAESSRIMLAESPVTRTERRRAADPPAA